MGMTQELLALVTALAHYLKILIRIALTGTLKLERDHGIGAIGPFLDQLRSLLIQNGSPSAHRMKVGVKDVAPPSHSSASINISTYGVAYGFRSLAPEIAGPSPFLDASQDLAISNVSVTGPPTDVCVACNLTIEEDCVRLGAYQRWHSECIRCTLCGIDATSAATGNVEYKSLVGSGTGCRISTARRPPANVALFVWWSESVTSHSSFGKVPTAIYCKDHALPGCFGGFQAVSRLEQYAFLLNVALRLYLLKKRRVIPPTPSGTCCVLRLPYTASAVNIVSTTSADPKPLSSGEGVVEQTSKGSVERSSGGDEKKRIGQSTTKVTRSEARNGARGRF